MSESSGVDAAFERSRERFESVVGFLHGSQAAGLTHSELETRLSVDARELIRVLYQDHLDLRTTREVRLPVLTDAAGICRGAVERGHRRPLQTVFGAVNVDRLAYRHRGEANLYPADAALNLPTEVHSHGLRELAAVESARGSFDDARSALRRATGVEIGKRQVERLAGRAAVDFEAYYEQPTRTPADDGDVLVLSADGKGIVMRSDALRPATAKAAAKATGKLKTRLSKGEKRNRKRMAEVGAVYDATPVARNPTDIIGSDPHAGKPPAPTAKNKWLTASVVDDAATVISQIFDEAQRRDPDHQRTWIAMVDGAKHQIDRIETEAKARQVEVHIVCDFVHVLEYISAPRGARLYPPPSGERLEGTSLGPMAYLALKKKGDRSMPLNQRSCPGVWGGALGDPRDMAKARLPESQFPEGASRTPAGKTPETGAAPAPGSICAWRNLPGYGAMPSEGIQGNEWDA
jgi:hypothetical protein